MQIQLAIGEQDNRYLNNLLTFFEKNHMDQLEIYSFTKPDMLLPFLADNPVHVILIDEAFGVTPKDVGQYGGVAWLSERPAAEDGEQKKIIEKYKKPDLIFRDILDLYAENGGRAVPRKKDFSGSCHLLLVTGFSGGTGASTVAAAAAIYLASQGEKTLYLNLERNGSSEDFFSGAGNYRFEDIIYALKSKRANVRLKMESCVRKDASGVCYFAPCAASMYMLELSHADIMNILSVLRSCGDYQNVVVDIDFALGFECVEIMDQMDRILVVNDGTETANTKFLRTCQAIAILEEQKKINVTGRMALLYNRFSSSKSSSQIQGNQTQIPVIGTFPPVKHALVREIIEIMVSKKEIFSRIKGGEHT